MVAPGREQAGAARLGYADLLRLMAMATGDESHDRAAESTLDVLWVLYDRVLHVDPARPRDPERDRFVLSKGHGPLAYYAVLAAKGFIDPSLLGGFCRLDSPLGRHPDRMLIPGVEASTGSLGHGLPMAVGMALALRVRRSARPRVICLLGDGELDEGSVHEAIAFAGRAGLDSLTAVVIDNRSARWGWPGGAAGRFALEGWIAATVDGRDHAALAAALADRREARPRVVVAEVLSGAGR
jgi:transketolase